MQELEELLDVTIANYHCTPHDGLNGNTPLEAMSMSCMPACTAAGGISELINDSNNGVIVPVDEPMLLVKKLSEYILYPEKIKAAAKLARQTAVNECSINIMVKELENVYQELTTV